MLKNPVKIPRPNGGRLRKFNHFFLMVKFSWSYMISSFYMKLLTDRQKIKKNWLLHYFLR